jgi:peptidoglycan/LPS O-acetylase OafA/YrhL/lysophospholipase L1-like esterase
MMSSSNENRSAGGGGARLPYLPALDGLRALAVIAVLLYHANMAWIPGGFLGVEMFFVISGYLITSLLLAEWAAEGGVDFKAFWLRRARRLLPALFLLLLAVVGYAVVFLPSEVAGLRGDALSTAGYVNNWYQIFSHKSYFESVGRPPLLRHMWSLAVEEQFYLVWPLLFSLALAPRRRSFALGLVLAGALASALAMAGLFRPDADPSRVYYGTDTRAAGLLLGAALAWLWPPTREAVEPSAGIADAIGLAGLGTLLACFLLLNEFQPFLYRGGFTLCDIATAELLAVAVHPRARLLPRLLAWEPLRWVGLRSYGIYLWHFPVFMLTRPQLDVPLDGVPLLARRLATTGAIAALSYRFVEIPIRQGALGRAWKQWRQAQGRDRTWLGLRWAAGSLSVAGISGALGFMLLTAQAPAPPEYLVEGAERPGTEATVQQGGWAAALGGSVPFVPAFPPVIPPAEDYAALIASSGESAIAAQPPSNQAPATASAQPAPLPASTNAPAAGFWLTAVGDSVLEGVADELRRNLGTNIIVNADQGRLPWNTPAIVHDLHAAGRIYPVVVLHIGNNGFLSPEVFGQIMAEFKDARRVVVVNIKAPRRWESVNNQMLASAIKSYPNAVLVDWHGASAGRPKIFWKDGIHLRPEGARVYADLVAQAIKAS